MHKSSFFRTLFVEHDRRIPFALLVLLLFGYFGGVAYGQTVSPIGGLGSIQLLDKNGSPALSGCIYFYQAGTTTQQATYTDSTGTQLNTNPVCLGSGARANIWLTSGAFYKIVACLQNDGPVCAPADVLFSVDQVPGSSGGSSGGSTFTGTFISGSVNPSTTGILRLANADTICWRNAAGTANLCIRKDSTDLLSWDGGAIKFPEVNAPGPVTNFDNLWADQAAHRWMMENNGAAAVQVVASGVDINTSDQVTKVHFGATAIPFSTVAPTINQFLEFDGTNVVGASGISAIAQSFPNGALGTTANLVVKFQAAATPAQVVTTTTADTTGAIGICLSSCSNTGTAVVITHGMTNCAFDGATTAGDYAVLSATATSGSPIAGNCHDAGSTQPVGVEILGRVLSTNGIGGTYGITLNLMQTVPKIQQVRTTSTCTTGSSSYDNCNNTLTWPVTFGDTAYTTTCSGKAPSEVGAGNDAPTLNLVSNTATTITVITQTQRSQTAHFTEIGCMAIHD